MDQAHSFLELGESYSFHPKLTACFTNDCLPAGTPAEKKAIEKADYVLIRTLGGFGTLKIGSAEFILEEGCLILLENEPEEFVFPKGEDVRYILFFFSCDKTPPCFIKKQRYIIQHSASEMSVLSLLYNKFEGEPKISASMRHSSFQMLYFIWAQMVQKGAAHVTPYRYDILKSAEYIRAHLGENVSMSKLANYAGLSERNFRKIFTIEMGVSPKAYYQRERLKEACRLLSDRTQSIGLISENLGYYSQFQFSRSFKKAFGMTPSEYRMTNAVMANSSDKEEFLNIYK